MRYILLTLIIGFVFSPTTTFAQVSSTIDVTAKINVCGDNVAEGFENCDNGDLKGGTCENQNLGPGTLSCDIACEYDTSACASPTPTPTPTSVQTIKPTTQQSQSSSQTTSSPTTIFESLITTATTTVENIIDNTISCIPNPLKEFDVNDDCKLSLSHMRESIGLWVQQTRFQPVSERRCDFNGDATCNLVDFSIMMYYIKE